ncbi:tRNA isopentenyltransferase [Naematelia encephala]|uniref:tRNA isopentenyltransferase n=1 Tax=Naematelia encephala TaxID=71784 RepID=A0A1Y2BEA1_9TREE|nr:tRNA isopentenyltransferase [Naematelia encephala]
MLRSSRVLPGMLHRSSARQRPIVAVIGTTGVGKSDLAVSLAQTVPLSLVLSADSMQLYKGLDVITNKMTRQEMKGVEHWGLDLVQPGEGGSWEVGRWCGEADKIIASLDAQALPIVCGGTHYFIQHFLFPPSQLSFDRPPEQPLDKGKSPSTPIDVRWKPRRPRPETPSDLDPELSELLDTFWTSSPTWPGETSPASGPSTSRPSVVDDHQALSLHRLLTAVDPKEAGRWHWRDGRKVRRAIERWWERDGVDLVVTEEDSREDPKSAGRKARFKTLVFWVYEPMDTLRPRLDQRVNKMVENGLLREIAEMRQIATKMYGSSDAVDHTEGIFQAIGYKEFAALPLPQSDPSLDPVFPQMLAHTKIRTQQYAKSQLKWIRKQFLPALREARRLGGEVDIYVVRGGPTGVDGAREVLKSFLHDEPLPDPHTFGHPDAAALLGQLDVEAATAVPDIAQRQVLNSMTQCDLCSTAGQPFSLRTDEWELHLTSKTHIRSVNGSGWR